MSNSSQIFYFYTVRNLISILLLFVLLTSCKDPVISAPKKKVEMETKFEQALKENKSRDVWQRPGQVLDLLGNISGKTIADIGAGTGFFAFRLLFRNAQVIALDIDPEMLEIMESFQTNLSSEMRTKFQTRLALPNDPKLEKDEADVILIINTVGYISNRKEYISNLYNQLPKGGQLMIVDFKRKELPIEAPEQEYRVSLFEIEKELKEVGFTIAESNDSILDYQYVVIGEK